MAPSFSGSSSGTISETMPWMWGWGDAFKSFIPEQRSAAPPSPPVFQVTHYRLVPIPAHLRQLPPQQPWISAGHQMPLPPLQQFAASTYAPLPLPPPQQLALSAAIAAPTHRPPQQQMGLLTAPAQLMSAPPAAARPKSKYGDSHKASEKRRRIILKTQWDTLAALVPAAAREWTKKGQIWAVVKEMYDLVAGNGAVQRALEQMKEGDGDEEMADV